MNFWQVVHHVVQIIIIIIIILFVLIAHQYDHSTYDNRTGQQGTNVH